MEEEKKNYDVVIVGAGPAGLTAAIYSARREMKTIIIAKSLGGQALILMKYQLLVKLKTVSLLKPIKMNILRRPWCLLSV